MLAYLQSYGYSALALYVVFHPSRLRSRTVCDDHTKFYIAFFKCIPIDDGGLIVCRIVVISAIVIKSISVPVTFDLLPVRYGGKVERMHRYVTKRYPLKPLRALVLLVLWAISVTNTELLLKCNKLHMGHWDFGQVCIARLFSHIRIQSTE